MSRKCVIAGSFDPVTNGHVGIIEDASNLFDEVVVAVLNNVSKRYMFSAAQRLELLEIACTDFPAGQIRTVRWDGLLVQLLDELDTNIIVRGIRDSRDTDAERQMAEVNAELRPGTRTVWVGGGRENWAISSTIVRELIAFNGDISHFVPLNVANRIRELRAAEAPAEEGGAAEDRR